MEGFKFCAAGFHHRSNHASRHAGVFHRRLRFEFGGYFVRDPPPHLRVWDVDAGGGLLHRLRPHPALLCVFLACLCRAHPHALVFGCLFRTPKFRLRNFDVGLGRVGIAGVQPIPSELGGAGSLVYKACWLPCQALRWRS